MTVRLGLRLALRGGREAAVRLALVAAAVAAGVAVLLSTLSLFNAFQDVAGRPCWECTTGPAAGGRAIGAAPGAVLWNYREDVYAGRTIKRLDVAVLGPGAPAFPGLAALPAAGRYHVSPALAELLDTVPSAQLGDRFPGVRAGLIGRAALSGPDELAAVAGRTPQELAGMAGTVQVRAVSAGPAAGDTTALYRHGFALAGIGLLVPLLVLIGNATRLAAARREARFAAIRLVGATSRQVNVIAATEAALGALLGAAGGIVLFQAVRPALANVAITGERFFPSTVAPSALQYAAVLAGVPLAAALAALWSLRRVRISPLGAARRAPASAPRWWRVLPLPAGLVLFAGPVFWGDDLDPVLGDAGLALVMLGLITGGPWLTWRAARLVARRPRGAASLLAAQRLAADPKAGFRAVSGIVLAVFLGTAVAGIVPAVVSGQLAAGGGTLNDVLRASFERPLPPDASAELLAGLRARPGLTVLPVYDRGLAVELPIPPPACYPGCKVDAMLRDVVVCRDLARFPALGGCPAGAPAVATAFRRLLGIDNMLSIARDLPIVATNNPAFRDDVTGLGLSGVLVRAGDAAAREEVRTLLAGYLARTGSADLPQTFAEVAEARAVLLRQAERVALAVVVVTLVVAGCGLLVSVAGGLVERRRPFTLLRLSGTPARTLSRVVLLETAVPLVVAAVLAAAAGLGVAGPAVDALAIRNAPTALPGPAYFLTAGGGLAAALLVIVAALPLLKRMTAPDDARFE
ncbi:FtsX-like permease family protein [Nonomuraea sp. NPDC050783]|uniref:FtsX-like permease family protein n=1 Tax=Nonomuraea sp. NPDC050783 TaxID=3154634 RepID=UPI003467108C